MSLINQLRETCHTANKERYAEQMKQRIPRLKARLAQRLENAAMHGKTSVRLPIYDAHEEVLKWLDEEGFKLRHVQAETEFYIVSF